MVTAFHHVMVADIAARKVRSNEHKMFSDVRQTKVYFLTHF